MTPEWGQWFDTAESRRFQKTSVFPAMFVCILGFRGLRHSQDPRSSPLDVSKGHRDTVVSQTVLLTVRARHFIVRLAQSTIIGAVPWMVFPLNCQHC
jgi:hypothetical protein